MTSFPFRYEIPRLVLIIHPTYLMRQKCQSTKSERWKFFFFRQPHAHHHRREAKKLGKKFIMKTRATKKKLWKRFINSHTSFWSFFAAVFVIKADITLNSFSPLFHFLFFALPSLDWRYHAPIFYLLYALMPLGNILAEIAATMRLSCFVMRAVLAVILAAIAIATLKLKMLESRVTRSLSLSVSRIVEAMTHKLSAAALSLRRRLSDSRDVSGKLQFTFRSF